ncbi:GNAT family N-acetyltransferase [Candidatus Saccharibacteria bacterium]|nr:GNAT family N-acetyltransferase [Candidatus Saccharibacteria bacterium]
MIKPELDRLAVEIGRAVPDDAETICDIRDRAWLEAYPNDQLGVTVDDVRIMAQGPNGEYVPRRIAYLKDQLGKEDGTGETTFVAKLDDKVVGFIDPRIDKQNHRRVGAIYVAPEAQGKGIGSKLMNQALDWYGRDRDIYLEVVSYNQNAINFYESFGFVQTNAVVVPEEGRPSYLKVLPQIEMVLKADKEVGAHSILTYDQYAEIEKHGLDMPYIVEAGHGSQRLLFYGSEHTNNPEHPQFRDIEERWDRFIAEAGKPIALVEGRFDEVAEDETRDGTKAIVDGGEAQFVVYLARKYGIEVISPEPDRVWEASELAKEFGRENVAFYYFIRQVSWWNRFTEKPDITVEVDKMLELMKNAYRWDNVDFSVGRMEAIHKELFKKPLEWSDTQWIYDITTPTPQEHITNQIARKSGELRDECVFRQIERYWKDGRSPFAIFGSAHAIRLEPALQKTLK